MADVDIAPHQNKASWEKGDFSRIAETSRKSGQEFVASLGIAPGMRVLDLGCGDGTTALPAARKGADVLGVDIASNLVAAGNARAKAEQLHNIRFIEGDAADLTGIPDGGFDLVISTFGAMFALRPLDVAKEMVRVTRPAGRIVMANWIPGDRSFVAETIRISFNYLPAPPPGFVSPFTWGIEGQVVERFAAAGIKPGNIRFERAIWRTRFAGSPAEMIDLFRSYNGPAMETYAAAERQHRTQELEREMLDLIDTHNHATDSGIELASTYLKVIVTRD